MEELFCSLCKKKKNSEPLDMEDPVFGTYVKIVRRIGISRHEEKLGVCGDCMERYKKLGDNFQKKSMTYFVLGLILGVLYFYFTQNFFISFLVAFSVMSLSLISYVPPLIKVNSDSIVKPNSEHQNK